jgi:hypothetical protein
MLAWIGPLTSGVREDDAVLVVGQGAGVVVAEGVGVGLAVELGIDAGPR